MLAVKNLFLFFFVFAINFCSAQSISLCSWNIQNFGKSKDAIELEFIANVVKDYDAVAIIEVVAGYGGAQAVAKLSDILNRKGAKWDYRISDPTSSVTGGSERYAVLWKTSKLKLSGVPALEKKYQAQLEREPYIVSFQAGNRIFTLAAFHAVPKAKIPQTEIKLLPLISAEYPGKNLVFCGDFNCSQKDAAFNPLKTLHYKPALIDQKTSLKNSCVANDCLSQEYDNIFFLPSSISCKESGVIHFYKKFQSLKQAKQISDHLPVSFQFSLN